MSAEKALKVAVSALYFDDSADYQTALYEIVALLGGGEAAELLQDNPAEAYLKYAMSEKE